MNFLSLIILNLVLLLKKTDQSPINPITKQRHLSNRINLYFDEESKPLSLFKKLKKRDTQLAASSDVSIESLNTIIENSFNGYKVSLIQLYAENNDLINGLISSDEGLFNEFIQNILNKTISEGLQNHVSEQIIKDETKKSLGNLEMDREQLLILTRDENAKDLAQVINSLNELANELSSKLSAIDINNKNETITTLNIILFESMSQLAKLKSDDLALYNQSLNNAETNETNKLIKIMSEVDKFKLKKPEETDLLKGIFEEQSLLSENTNNQMKFLSILSQEIETLKTNLDQKSEQTYNQLLNSFNLLNRNVVTHFDSTANSLIQQVLKLYPLNEEAYVMISEIINKSFTNYTTELSNLFNVNATNDLVSSDQDLFDEFTEKVLNEINKNGIKGHINETLIRYETNKSVGNLEMDRTTFLQLVANEIQKDLSQFIIKISDSGLDLNQKLTLIDLDHKAETMSVLNNYYKTITELQKQKIENNLKKSVSISSGLAELKSRKQEETNQLLDVFTKHISHSELFLSADQQQNHSLFVSFLLQEIDKLKVNLESKQNDMEAALQNRFEVSTNDSFTKLAATVKRMIEKISLYYGEQPDSEDHFSIDLNNQNGLTLESNAVKVDNETNTPSETTIEEAASEQVAVNSETKESANLEESSSEPSIINVLSSETPLVEDQETPNLISVATNEDLTTKTSTEWIILTDQSTDSTLVSPTDDSLNADSKNLLENVNSAPLVSETESSEVVLSQETTEQTLQESTNENIDSTQETIIETLNNESLSSETKTSEAIFESDLATQETPIVLPTEAIFESDLVTQETPFVLPNETIQHNSDGSQSLLISNDSIAETTQEQSAEQSMDSKEFVTEEATASSVIESANEITGVSSQETVLESSTEQSIEFKENTTGEVSASSVIESANVITDVSSQETVLESSTEQSIEFKENTTGEVSASQESTNEVIQETVEQSESSNIDSTTTETSLNSHEIEHKATQSLVTQSNEVSTNLETLESNDSVDQSALDTETTLTQSNQDTTLNDWQINYSTSQSEDSSDEFSIINDSASTDAPEAVLNQEITDQRITESDVATQDASFVFQTEAIQQESDGFSINTAEFGSTESSVTTLANLEVTNPSENVLNPTFESPVETKNEVNDLDDDDDDEINDLDDDTKSNEQSAKNLQENTPNNSKIIDYLTFNIGSNCISGLLFEYSNNETKLIGTNGLASKRLSFTNRKLYSLKKVTLNRINFIEICFVEEKSKYCELISNKDLKTETIDFDLHTITNITGKFYETLGLFGSYDQDTRCISKIGVIYKEVKARAMIAKVEVSKIEKIIFSYDRQCIKGLHQVFNNGEEIPIGLTNLPGLKETEIDFSRSLVSLKYAEDATFIEFCFVDNDTNEKQCDKVRNNYKTNLQVKEFDLDELNDDDSFHETIGLNGSIDKITKCVKRLEIAYKAICGNDETQPC